ncbi:hypothetical protein DN745_06085 [Bradymonas sediminis]|uniref:Outer membrane protein beta-barrel domain-containing protein n=1 Tax=Bradymonas sediminis TaxID=1548548 RepID=A0A2Z4FIR9_9DELT|nr:hypothetical protein DN745_06085 [Bradymonas sediminis]
MQGRQIQPSLILAARAALLASVALGWATLLPSVAHADPPQFGVEVGVGAALGLSPYLRNEVVAQPLPTSGTDERPWIIPSLAHIETGRSVAASLKLVASNLTAGASLQVFDLPSFTTYYRGDRALPPTRQRADGSVDDSGTEYAPLSPPINESIPSRLQDSLIVVGLGGDYRIYWPDEAIDFFIPIGAEIVLTHVTRPAASNRLGLAMSTGVGAVLDINSRIGLVFDARLHALATSHYGRRSDSARRAAAIGESTEAAFFSTLLYASANIGLQFTIR